MKKIFCDVCDNEIKGECEKQIHLADEIYHDVCPACLMAIKKLISVRGTKCSVA